MIRNRKSLIQAGVILTFILLTILWCKPLHKTSPGQQHIFNVGQLTHQYDSACFEGKLSQSIGGLEENLRRWSEAVDRRCQISWAKFQDMFGVSARRGTLHLPPKFRTKVGGWLGNNEELVKQVYNQTVFHVRNTYTLEHTVYNPLRSLRPGSASDENPRDYVQRLARETNGTCDFCDYKEMTAEDVFDRIEGKFSVSAANTFKLDKWHGLFLTKKHNPLDLREEDVLDLFNTSIKWFHKVSTIDPTARYPVMIWDSLPHAGASQLHPHLHGMLDPDQYYGAIHVQHEAARKYNRYTGNNYWQDFIEIHHALGLTVTLGSAVALTPLTSRKDHEIIILSNEPCAEAFRLLFQVIQTFYNELKLFCFSCGIGFPSINDHDGTNNNPLVIRIGTRGDCSQIRSDISSLELYSVNNVNADPYKTISLVREVLNNYLLSSQRRSSPLAKWPSDDT